jgi:hypothetical protein
MKIFFLYMAIIWAIIIVTVCPPKVMLIITVLNLATLLILFIKLIRK